MKELMREYEGAASSKINRKASEPIKAVLPAPVPRRHFKVTQNRVATYGPTPGCEGC